MKFDTWYRVRCFVFIILLGGSGHISALPGTPEDWWQKDYEQGLKLLENKELDAAEKKFKAILKKDKKIPQANYGLGLVYFDLEPDSKKAEKYFKRATDLDKNYGAAFYQLGLVYMNRRNEMFRARKFFQMAVRRDPSLVNAWGDLGRVEANLWPYGGGLVGVYAKGVKNVPDSRKLYSHFINSALWQGEEDEAVGILQYLIGRYPKRNYFKLELANLYFDIGKIEKSVEIVEQLNKQPATVLESRLRLLEAKLACERGEPAEALNSYYHAVAAIRDSVDAATIFNDARYVMNDAEFERLQNTPLDSLPIFYGSFWRARDPNLATPHSEALIEFYQRLSFARRQYRLFVPGYDEVEEKYARMHPYRTYLLHGQALLEAANLPKALQGERDLDDLGLLYVRHGEPDREIVSMDGVPMGLKENEYVTKILDRLDYYDSLPDVYLFSPLDGSGFTRVPQPTAGETLYTGAFFANLPTNQTWLYQANSQHPQMIFHFKKWEGQTGWLIESIPYAVAEREVLSENFGRLGRESFNSQPDHREVERLCELIHQESVNYLRVGLQTESRNYSEAGQSLPFPFEFLTFKGDSNKTRVEAYYAIGGQVTDLAIEDSASFLDVDQFIGIYNQQWDEVVRVVSNPRKKMDISQTEWEQRAVLNVHQFNIAPGYYRYAIRLTDNTSRRTGAHRGNYSFKDYSKDELLLSDILVSAPFMKTDKPGPFQKGDITYNPRMFSALMTGSLGGVYFEAYNLRLNKGKSRFKIRCKIRPAGTEQKFKELQGYSSSLLAEKPAVLILSNEYSGAFGDEKLYVNFELGNREPGRYELVVEVLDLNSQETARSRASVLVQ